MKKFDEAIKNEKKIFDTRAQGLKTFYKEDRLKRLQDNYAWVDKPDNQYDKDLEELTASQLEERYGINPFQRSDFHLNLMFAHMKFDCIIELFIIAMRQRRRFH